MHWTNSGSGPQLRQRKAEGIVALTPNSNSIRFVLCRPSHPGNIGAAARAIKAMGFGDLRLVAPERFPAPEAQWMATHAVDVLQAAQV
jgi:tRNA C32,U32 (ribose-2'-O)-methylase TrmJ